MRTRLRPAYSDEQLAAIYPKPHRHHLWPEHILRVQTLIAMCKWVGPVESVADLSCGDGTIAKAVAARPILGDLAFDTGRLTGPIEQTIGTIQAVDLFILAETLEHLDDPDGILRQIRAKAKYLVLSTPVGEKDGGNPEHIWGWDINDVEDMLTDAEFSPMQMTTLHFPLTHVIFQCWLCQ
jgi:hypothetical protein